MRVANSEGGFASAWRDLRARRLLYWGSWLAIIPAVFVGNFLDEHWHSRIPLLLLLLATMVFHLSVWQKLVSFRCPRCGQPFLWLYSTLRPLPRLGMPVFMQSQCANCGLPKFAFESRNDAANGLTGTVLPLVHD
jgi:predicted RNA-binding Zn-ribbon protein involved in translation (DUF1610 family)